MVEKRVKKFGQCTKENIFFQEGFPKVQFDNKKGLNVSISALETLKNHTYPQFQPNFTICVSLYLEKCAFIVTYHV